jgi:hypothetical protein
LAQCPGWPHLKHGFMAAPVADTNCAALPPCQLLLLLPPPPPRWCQPPSPAAAAAGPLLLPPAGAVAAAAPRFLLLPVALLPAAAPERAPRAAVDCCCCCGGWNSSAHLNFMQASASSAGLLHLKNTRPGLAAVLDVPTRTGSPCSGHRGTAPELPAPPPAAAAVLEARAPLGLAATTATTLAALAPLLVQLSCL